MPQAQANMGLQAYFYNNYTEDNQYNNAPPIPPDRPVLFSIPVATVDQNFDLYPMNGLYEDFVVKYEGYITATESGTANLQCLADDGCIVIIDSVTVIDEWYDKGTSGGVYQYQMVPNQSLPFTVWYYENGGGAVIQLRWQLEGRDWEVIPEAVFSTAPKLIPIVESPSETHTVVSETITVVDTPTVISDTQTSTSDSPTVTVSDTSVVIVETPTSLETLTPVESTTPVVETGTVPVETLPLPTPEPIRPEPVVVPEPQPVLQPEPEIEVEVEVEPEPEPEPLPEEIDTEVPLEEPPLDEEPVVEEPESVEEPSEYPEEEEMSETPVEPEIQEQPEQTPEPSPEPVVIDEPTPVVDVAPEPPSINSVDLESLAPDTPVALENGVVVTAEVAIAVALLQDPTELFTELFTDPGAVLTALGSVGADMTPEEREESEKVVVSAIIAGGIATQSAAIAAGAAAYRRNP